MRSEEEPRERTVLGVPWDWRRPTAERVRRRTWNPEDPRLFTPTPFGHGHVVNGYWVVHPLQYARQLLRGGSR